MIREFVDRYASPEERDRIVAALLTLAVLLCLAALFLAVVVPGLRGTLAPVPAGPLAGPSRTGWLDPADAPPRKGYTLPPVDAAALLAGGERLLARGGELYGTHCAACHGSLGRGDGPAAPGLSPRPRDFTRADGWRHGASLPGIFRTLAEGIPGGSMAAYDFLPRGDRMALAHAVRAFLSPAPSPGAPEELAALKASLGGGGETVAPTVPLSRAVELLATEAADAASRLPGGERFAALPDPWGAAVADPARAARALVRNPAWRDSPAALAALAVAGAPGNGFSPASAHIPLPRWLRLHEALLPLLPAPEVSR